MGTRSAAYTLKLTSLHDYYQRLLHGTQPTPSGFDMANTVKYFSQTLLSLLKEVRQSPMDMLKSQKFDPERLALYPSLDYKQLYNALYQLVDVVSFVHIGLAAFGEALLQCLACLMPFLDHDLLDTLAYLTASSISVLPAELHQEIVNHLCFYILPFTISKFINQYFRQKINLIVFFLFSARKTIDETENYASQSVSAVIMMIFQYSTNAAHHCQLLECLMALKHGVVKDILCVAAYGTAQARASAAKLLFYYWPTFNQNLFDRRAVLMKFSNDLTPFICQRDTCPNAGNAEAGKVCYDHRISITYAAELPPPLYLCIECANEIHREHPNQIFHDILHPMQQVSMVCENKNCRATDKSAISVCFSIECASYNGNHPIRYCQQCHNIRHNNRRGGDHVYHMALPHVSQMDPQSQIYLVQAIVSLLKEAEPLNLDSNRGNTTELNTSKTTIGFPGSVSSASAGVIGGVGGSNQKFGLSDSTTLEERQLLGRYGVWLLVGLCTPNHDTQIEILGRLLSMLFHWFHITAYSFDGQAESTLEKLKTEYVCGWLGEVMKTHYQVFISCLLPHPADYVRVGGHWETLASRTSHLKDGLNRLFCLVPYEVITSEIWDYVMPHWMEAVVNDVPEDELYELKMILCKILDTEMSPLGFDAKKMYNFVAKRFTNTSAKVQEQALNWLQTLTLLDITIPLTQLFSMFTDGVDAMSANSYTDFDDKLYKTSINSENDDPTTIYPVIENDSGQSSPLSDDMLPISRHMQFTTNSELNISCCILMLDIILKQMELQDIDKNTGINTWICRDACNLMKSIIAANWNDGHICKENKECSYCESRVIWHQLCFQLIQYMCPVNPAQPPDVIVDENSDDHGRKSPPESSKKSQDKPDVVINMMVPDIHSVGGVLVHMPHFFEQIMTATVETVSEQLDLAAILPAEKVMSAVARSVTLTDSDVATATVNVAKANLIGENDEPVSPIIENEMDDFWHTTMGKFRFNIEELPEQLQYIYKLLKEIITCLNILVLHGEAFTTAVKDHQGFFIWCQENLLIKPLWDLLNAEHSHIAQVTVPLLLHCITLQCGTDTFWRLIQEEFHSSDWRIRFVAVERVTLIARFMDSTPLRNVLTLQAALANAFCYMITNLRNTDMNSEIFMKKLHRAQEALSQSDGSGASSVRTLSASFGTKWPYKRTMSAPASMIPRQDTKQEKEKIYSRQYSAPILKRKSSRFGLGQLRGLIPSSNNLTDGHVHSLNMVEEAGALPGYAHKIVELEEADKETMHLLVFLFMQFLSRQDQAYPTDEKPLSKTQGIVLRHLYLLLGYNQTERTFHLSPQRLRLSSVFNVFLANLPQLLDQNHAMGLVMIPPVIAILQYSPCPPQKTPPTDHQPPTYSLWYLEPNNRRSWLMSLLVILYKGQYGQQPWCNQLQSLIKMVINTLDAQQHQCKRIPATVVMAGPPSRSRDVSQPSLGPDHDLITSVVGEMDSESPPIKQQGFSMHQRSPGPGLGPSYTMETHWEEAGPTSHFSKHTRKQSYSMNADDTESELAAIPESPKSDSTLHGSGGSLGELEDASALVNRSASMMMMMTTRASIPNSLIQSKKNNEQANKEIRTKTTETRPTWILGSEDETNQTNTSALQKKWSLQEGVKMMVASTLLPGQHNFSLKSTQKSSMIGDKGGGGQKSVDSTIGVIQQKTIVPTALAITLQTSGQSLSTSSSSSTSSKERTNSSSTKSDNNNIDQTNQKHLDRQKNIDQSPPLISPVSSCNIGCHNIGSDDSSSQAVSSMSSQRASTDNGQIQTTGWPINVERLLPIGSGSRTAINRPSMSTHRVLRCEDTYGSPESPLSKMDVLMINSSFEQDSENASSDITSPRSMSQLEFPMPERLLPIGIQEKGILGLVERVRQALGVPELEESFKNSIDEQDLSLKFDKQDSLGDELISGSLLPTNDDTPSRCASPRRLIKQVALESPPGPLENDDFCFRLLDHERKAKFRDHARAGRDRARRAHASTTCHIIGQPRRTELWSGSHSQPNLDAAAQQACHADFNLKQSTFRVGDDCIFDRCSECGTIKEEYSDEELGLCIITLGTFIHREPALAAPLLPEILGIVTKAASNSMYPWQSETNMHLPGGAISVAHQFLRCVLHQLAPNGIFVQIFQTHINESTRIQFFKSVSQALVDFNELNPIAPLQLLLEMLNGKKSLPVDHLPIILYNVACYLDCLPLEAGLGPGAATWSGLVAQFDVFCRRLVLILSSLNDTAPLLRIMISILKVPGIHQTKSILEPFSKILSYTIQHSILKYSYLTDLCYLCHRAYLRERDKHLLGRTIVFELVQAMKFKTTIPDNNFLLLLQFVLQDVGGSLPTTVTIENIYTENPQIFNTNASESLRNQISDMLEFLADFHTISKIKSYNKGMQAGLNEDTLGGTLKCGFAQYLALEITRGNNRENRAIARYLPWLYTAPSSVVQGPREFVECIGHIRLLSWLLLGALTHTAMHSGCQNNTHSHGPPVPVAQPVPQEVSCHVADHIQVIFSGFPEQSKTSVLHMSSLFHAFILCQLWTVYLEEVSRNNSSNLESFNITMNILLEFWGKVTPSILHLVSLSKTFADTVNLHFLSLLEALLESQSVLLSKLLPLWSPILFFHQNKLPGFLQMRLQNCRNFPPSKMADHYISNRRESNAILLRWLHRLQFKMGQIEMQSSTVTTQFYSI
ncbi:hypothetical protein HCN44_011109 [Aphidius gifuensis]|uniref:Protein unc-79 homolog n=1 Tax=Aphidius gifuensis TaxID=684658 RepID=A0A834XUS8_APHGI|nr:hypothetical protein HCN44_011109 [Aphidius gifuensis]